MDFENIQLVDLEQTKDKREFSEMSNIHSYTKNMNRKTSEMFIKILLT